MKVILNQDIKGLGKKGDIKEASDGYARNYLLPRNLVVEASKGNVNLITEQKKGIQIRKEREKEDAQDFANKISQTTITIRERAGEDGRLFGSVTTKDIAQALQSQKKIQVDKRKIFLAEPIRHIGNISVEIKVYPEITGNLTVKVEALK